MIFIKSFWFHNKNLLNTFLEIQNLMNQISFLNRDFKGTVYIILNIEGFVRFTTVPFKPFFWSRMKKISLFDYFQLWFSVIVACRLKMSEFNTFLDKKTKILSSFFLRSMFKSLKGENQLVPKYVSKILKTYFKLR